MERHFHEELRELKEFLLKMASFVQVAIQKASEAFLSRNLELAQQVMDEESTINRLEIEIDDKGHSLSALGQPMAADLRLISMILKMNTDLERMGDHAVNIAERAILLAKESFFEENFQFPQMINAVLEMFQNG